jgi:PAS domain S-box-containing protein
MSQAVSSEIVRDRLVEKLLVMAVEHAGAGRGVLLLPDGDEMRVVGEAIAGQDAVAVSFCQAATASAELPESIIRHVIQTRKRVILDDSSNPNEFSKDEYIQREHPRSVLCLPLVKQTHLAGALYFENRLAAGVFTPSRHEVLEILASQAAISLENACRYGHLQRENAERKQAEEEMRRQKAHLDELFELAPAPIALLHEDGSLLRINLEFESLFGYTPEELVGTNAVDSIVPEEMRPEFEENKRLLKAGKRIDMETVRKRKDGQRLTVSLVGVRVPLPDGKVGVYAIYDDISERKNAADELRRKEAFLAEGQRLSKTGSYGWKVSTGELFWSEETYRIYQYEPTLKPIIPMVYQRVHPEDLDRMEEVCKRAAQEGKDYTHKFRAVMPDGSIKHIQIVAHSSRDESGNIEYVGSVMDVTEQKQAAEALRASERFARGQAEALSRALDAIARETSPDRIVEHVLRTMIKQLDAHSSSAWLRDEASGLMNLEFVLEDGEFKTKSDATLTAIGVSPSYEGAWQCPEMYCDGMPHILEDIREGPDFPWRANLLAKGVLSILSVPMLVAGKAAGVIEIRFARKRAFMAEEVDLAQALANQAMLAIQLARLSAQSRQSAIIAERNRMARDIHDTLAQGFTGVIMHLEAAEEAISRQRPEFVASHVRGAGEIARDGLREARRSVQALRPLALEEKKLSEALKALINKMTEGTTIQATVSLQGEVRELPPEWEANILRIGQEALTNVLRHAGASQVHAQLAYDNLDVRMRLRDNGRGFDPAKRHEGFGLRGIRERVVSMGGTLSLQSAEGRGTVVAIKLPLAADS